MKIYPFVVPIFDVKLRVTFLFAFSIQLSKEEYARKRIYNGCSVRIETSVARVTVRYHSASLEMPNSYPSDGIFNMHLATIKGSYILCSHGRKTTGYG